jgi:hypothetical protein
VSRNRGRVFAAEDGASLVEYSLAMVLIGLGCGCHEFRRTSHLRRLRRSAEEAGVIRDAVEDLIEAVETG